MSDPLSPTAKGTSAAGTGFQTPPTFAESQNGGDAGPLVDIDVVPADPRPSDLELVVGSKHDDADSESTPLVPDGPPPEFSQYNAVYFTTGNGDIVSHDPHLNEDGEALFRFLLAHASRKPALLLKCKGKHTEWHTRQVTNYQDGRNVTSTETHSETIVDFDFTIDLSANILTPTDGSAPIWIVGDKDAAYRGRRKQEVESPPTVVNDDGTRMADIEAGATRVWRRRATVSERNASESWAKQRENRGLAPWVLMRGQIKGMEASLEYEHDRVELAHSTHAGGEWYDDSSISAPSKHLRDWSDEYCASRRLLKEFVFRKVVYGWNLPAVRQAVESTIRNNYFGAYAGSSNIDVEFVMEGTTITIRAHNWFSRMLSNIWAVILLWIFLIYPLVIWPFKRFAARGGGKWEVGGSAFALNRYTLCQDGLEGEKAEDYRRRKTKEASGSSSSAPPHELPLLKDTPKGVSQLMGQREGEWFSQWEDTITSLVRQRHVSDLPIATPVGRLNTAGIGLDGYYPDGRR